MASRRKRRRLAKRKKNFRSPRASCEAKVRHEDKATAEKVAVHQGRLCEAPMHAYHCPHCDGWHVGRRKRFKNGLT